MPALSNARTGTSPCSPCSPRSPRRHSPDPSWHFGILPARQSNCQGCEISSALGSTRPLRRGLSSPLSSFPACDCAEDSVPDTSTRPRRQMRKVVDSVCWYACRPCGWGPPLQLSKVLAIDMPQPVRSSQAARATHQRVGHDHGPAGWARGCPIHVMHALDRGAISRANSTSAVAQSAPRGLLHVDWFLGKAGWRGISRLAGPAPRPTPT